MIIRSTGGSRNRICVVSPNMNGGIKRLFEMVFSQAAGADLVQLDWFASNSDAASNAWLFPARLARLLGHATSGHYDLYHFNLASKGSTLRKVLYSFPLRAFGRRYVVHLHGASFREFYASLPQVLRGQVRAFFRGAARIIVLGQAWRDFAVHEIGVPAEQVVILANAVKGPDAAVAYAANETPRLLFLGRLGARKGVPELLDALAAPEMSALPWTATIAGDGEVDVYRQRAEELGLSARVDFPSWVDGEQVTALLQRSNILVLPSHAENLPLSMLEGMGYGLCPVVTPVGAVEDVIRDGENGLLVPVRDARALAEALVKVCSDEGLRHRLARQARADFLAHYDIRDYRARLEAIYLEVIEARPVSD